jgi:hypothetical protein
MPKHLGRDWDCRPDGNGWIWRVFGEPGESLVVRQGWAASRPRAQDAAEAAILELVRPQSSVAARSSFPFLRLWKSRAA